jgi:hypothetical protein
MFYYDIGMHNPPQGSPPLYLYPAPQSPLNQYSLQPLTVLIPVPVTPGLLPETEKFQLEGKKITIENGRTSSTIRTNEEDRIIVQEDGKKKATAATTKKMVNFVCLSCGITTSPQRREGPDGKGTLCNACGLRYRKLLVRQRKAEEQGIDRKSLDFLVNDGNTRIRKRKIG